MTACTSGANTTADGLPDIGIESLHETASGILLVGTQKGLARLDGETFKAIPIPGMPAISSQQSLTSDPLGLLYVSTSQGLFIGLLAGAAYSFHLRCLLAVQRPTDCSLIPWARCGSAVVLVCALLPRMERKFSGVRLGCRWVVGTRSWPIRKAISGFAVRDTFACGARVRRSSSGA